MHNKTIYTIYIIAPSQMGGERDLTFLDRGTPLSWIGSPLYITSGKNIPYTPVSFDHPKSRKKGGGRMTKKKNRLF